jgi:glycosyltransferase involved in cell wall biosynthesis
MLDPWFRRHYPLKHLKKLPYWFLIQRAVLRDAAGVLFTCEEERTLARESVPAYDVRDVVVGYGIAEPPLSPERQRAAFAARFPEVADRRYLLYLSRIHPKKGLDILLHALAESGAAKEAGLRLVIAGPSGGRWERRLRGKTKALGLSDVVTWAGPLYGDEKWGALLGADAFILPSHQENFGIAVVEAMACGTPVLITKSINIWREIAATGAGLVFDDTVAGVKGGLDDWVNLGPDDRRLLSARGKQLFWDQFEVHSAAKRLEGLLRDGTAYRDSAAGAR